MSGWVPGSVGLRVPAGAMSGCGPPLPPRGAPAPAPPMSLDVVWSWRGFSGKRQRKTRAVLDLLAWELREGGKESGVGGSDLEEFCNFSGKPEEAEAGAAKRGHDIGCWGNCWAAEQLSALASTWDRTVYTFHVCSEVR